MSSSSPNNESNPTPVVLTPRPQLTAPSQHYGCSAASHQLPPGSIPAKSAPLVTYRDPSQRLAAAERLARACYLGRHNTYGSTTLLELMQMHLDRRSSARFALRQLRRLRSGVFDPPAGIARHESSLG